MVKIILMFLLVMIRTTYGKDVTGILLGKQQIIIKAKSQGEIMKINFDEGQKIKSGDVIAIIDDREEEIERNLASIEYNTAKSDFEKTKKLTKYVSEDEVIKKENFFQKKKTVLDLKEYNLDNTRVVSPISGLVAKKFVDKGETVSIGEKVFEVVDVDDLIIELYLLPEDTVELKLNSYLLFSTPLHKDRIFKAQVTYIGPVIDSTSGTIKVRLSLSNIKNKTNGYLLKPGTMVTVKL